MKRSTFTFAATLAALIVVGALLLTSKASSQAVQGTNPQSRLGIYGVMGFVIVRVDSGSTSEQAGLKPGDIVTDLNGQLTSIQEFQNAIWSSPPGTALNITYLRFNQATGKAEEHKVTVKTMRFMSRIQSIQRTVPVSTAPVPPADCPFGCCAVCKGLAPNRYCDIANRFIGFTGCVSDGFKCGGVYCT
jgi:membrane-associated protease RseP (regulator of RpoE activity)